MKEKIEHIIYVPTTRCNFRCIHCNQEKSCELKDEMPTEDIYNKIFESDYVKEDFALSVTGGEPFMKEGIDKFILMVLENHKNVIIDITTNGYYYDRIEKLVSQIVSKEKVHFALSIDGVGEVHNSIRKNEMAYKYAIKTLNILYKNKIDFHINTVMQDENIDIVEQLKSEIIGERCIAHACIPIVTDLAKSSQFCYGDEQIIKMWRYLNEDKDKKYVISRGKFKINNCHAGLSNLVIAPDGKIYTCLSGYTYMYCKEKYCVGSLKKDKIDNILNSNLRKDVIEFVIKNCKGCANPCEVMREEKKYALSTVLSNEEIIELHQLCIYTEESLYYDSSWHLEEKTAEYSFHWMKKKKSKILVKVLKKEFMLIDFFSAFPDDKLDKLILTIYINGIEKYKSIINEGNHNVLFDIKDISQNFIEIVFETNHIWKPSKFLGVADERDLGIALRDIKYYKNNLDLEKALSYIEWKYDTPLSAQNIKISLSCLQEKIIVKLGKMAIIKVKINNLGKAILSSSGRFPINVSYHIFDEQNNIIIYDGFRTQIKNILTSGMSEEIEVLVELPDNININKEYKLQITMVSEGLFWFEELSNQYCKELTLIIKKE